MDRTLPAEPVILLCVDGDDRLLAADDLLCDAPAELFMRASDPLSVDVTSCGSVKVVSAEEHESSLRVRELDGGVHGSLEHHIRGEAGVQLAIDGEKPPEPLTKERLDITRLGLCCTSRGIDLHCHELASARVGLKGLAKSLGERGSDALPAKSR